MKALERFVIGSPATVPALKMAAQRIIVLALFAFQAACFKDLPQAPLIIEMTTSGASCDLSIERHRVDMRELTDIGHRYASRRAIVIFERKVPTACVASAVTALHRAGIATIDAVLWYGAS